MRISVRRTKSVTVTTVVGLCKQMVQIRIQIKLVA
jgi:hypothetical protein